MAENEFSGQDRRQPTQHVVTLSDIEASFQKRMDKQDTDLENLRQLMLLRNAQDDDLRPTLHEMVLLWRGSKVIIPAIVVSCGAIWAVITWTKDHVRF